MRASRRQGLLRETYLFADLSEAALAKLASCAELRPFKADETLFTEGTPASTVFVLVEGTVEEQVATPEAPFPVSLAGRAEVLGEEALRPEAAGRYASTGKALTDGSVLAIPLAAAARAVAVPAAAAALEADRQLLYRVRLIKGATAFANLPIGAVRRLAATITERRLESGDALVVEGEPGEACFLVESGHFTVSHAAEPGVCLAQLGPGALIGEVSLLAGEPRRATVRAEVPSEVLVLERSALLSALEACGRTASRFAGPALARIRPRRRDGVEVHHAICPDGEPIVVLKDPVRRAYFQLSGLGQFVWERFDGSTPVSRIVAAAFRERGAFAPDAIGHIVSGLLQAGMASLTDGSDGRLLHRRTDGCPGGLRDWLTVQVKVVGEARAERWACRLHAGLRPLATPSGVAALIGLGVLGLGAMTIALAGLDHVSGLPQPGAGSLAMAALVAIVVHEAAHMVAMRAMGLQVHGIGLGWSWFFPVAYVDTTDVWIAGPRQRFAVAMAGPLSSFALGGGLSLAAALLPPGEGARLLWTHAAVNVVVALLALTPSGSNDGAQMLAAGLRNGRRSHVLRRSLSWLHGAATAAAAYLILAIFAAGPLRTGVGDAAPLVLGLGAAALALAFGRGITASVRP